MDILYPELLAAVKGSQECLEDLQQIAACLPQGDAELAACLEWLVDNRLKFEFDRVLHAALAVRRTVDVRILERDLAMLDDANWVAGLASKCKGDVGGFLLRLARLPRFVLSFRATLLIAASCYSEGTPPPVTKQELVDETGRLLPLLSRYSSKTPAASQTNDAMAVCALCQALGLPMPIDSIRIRAKGRLPGRSKEESARELVVDKALEYLHRIVNLVRYPAERLVAPTRDQIPPAKPGRGMVKGRQEKVGRNDPCPCNSGKKYKRCCMDRRENAEKVAIEQARDSSASHDVPEDALSLEIVRTASLPFLSRLDPERLPADLRHAVVDRLVHLRDVVGATRLWKKIGVTQDMDDIYVRALREALLQQNAGLLQELAGLVERDRLDSLLDCLPARLALVEPAPAAQAAMIETEVAKVLSDPVELSNLAVGLARWKMPALGLALERAALASGVDAKYARALTREVAGAREVLGLSPGDPSDSLVARLLDREQEQSELARELEEQRGQVHRMLAREKRYAEEVSRLQADLEMSQARHEARIQDGPSVQVPSAGADLPATVQQKDWRKRTEELKQQLNAVHSERNSLRKELAAAEAALAEREAQLQAAEAAESEKEEADEALLVGEELEGRQPVRAPVFPPRFLESIGQFPEPVRRDLVYTVGGMAAGYAHAIRGTRLLKSRPRFHRQHVGRQYRVILRLTPTELHVVALVNRKDLERRVESLPL